MNEGADNARGHKAAVFLEFHKGQVIWMSLNGHFVSFSRELRR